MRRAAKAILRCQLMAKHHQFHRAPPGRSRERVVVVCRPRAGSALHEQGDVGLRQERDGAFKGRSPIASSERLGVDIGAAALVAADSSAAVIIASEQREAAPWSELFKMMQRLPTTRIAQPRGQLGVAVMGTGGLGGGQGRGPVQLVVRGDPDALRRAPYEEGARVACPSRQAAYIGVRPSAPCGRSLRRIRASALHSMRAQRSKRGQAAWRRVR